MRTLLRLLVDIGLLRSAPQSLPASRALTVLLLVLHALTSAALAIPALDDNGLALVYGVTETALTAGMVALLLHATRRPERIAQTLAALAGCDGLLNLVALPLLASLGATPEGGPAALQALALLGIVGWSFTIYVHVLRHALEVPPPASIGVSIGLFGMAYLILGALFPVSG